MTTVDTRSFLPAEAFVGWRLDDALDPDRCAALLREVGARGFERTGERYPANYRDNDRLVFDDPALAKALFRELRARLPRTLGANGLPLDDTRTKREREAANDDVERWELVGLNPRFRACRYEGGQSFCIHRDGPYVPDDKRRSFLTIQFYLDDDPARVGGHTRFYADPRGETTCASIAPRAGTAIVFDHRAWHDGEPVTAGIKHVLRTDAIYRRSGGSKRRTGWGRVELERPDSLPNSVRIIDRHRGYAWHVTARPSIASAGRDGTIRMEVRSSFLKSNPALGVDVTVDAVDLGRGSVTCLVYGAMMTSDLWCGLRAGEVWMIGDAVHKIASGLGAVTSAAAWKEPPGARDPYDERDRRALVAFATSRGDIVAFDDETYAPAWTTLAHDGWAWGIAPTTDGFVSCGHDGHVKHIDSTGQVRSIAELGHPVRAIASLEPPVNEAAILAGDERGWLHWLAADGHVVRSHRAHAATVTSIATHGAHVITAGEDGAVKRWRDDGECDVILLERDDFITSVATTAKGDIIAAGYDGAIRLIHAE
ncbi:MAG: 2OG-Fe(II) oxygenase [Kofleriaceae bacterium]